MPKKRKRDSRTARKINFRNGDTFQICGAEISFTHGTGKLTATVKAPVCVRYRYRSRLSDGGAPK